MTVLGIIYLIAIGVMVIIFCIALMHFTEKMMKGVF